MHMLRLPCHYYFLGPEAGSSHFDVSRLNEIDAIYVDLACLDVEL